MKAELCEILVILAVMLAAGLLIRSCKTIDLQRERDRREAIIKCVQSGVQPEKCAEALR